MVFFNYALRKLNAKIVYYGPGLCGKTSNLQWIHDHFEGGHKGKMISLATEGDRTIFFDLLPLEIGKIRGMDVTLQLYTVPGQVHYNSTRQLVLKSADGVVYVADSQRAMLQSDLESWANLKENLLLQGLELESFPHVLQFNKRDLRDLLTIEDLDEALNEFDSPIFESVATQGIGVQETLEGIVKLVMRSLRDRYEAVSAPKEGARGQVSPPGGGLMSPTPPRSGILRPPAAVSPAGMSGPPSQSIAPPAAEPVEDSAAAAEEREAITHPTLETSSSAAPAASRATLPPVVGDEITAVMGGSDEADEAKLVTTQAIGQAKSEGEGAPFAPPAQADAGLSSEPEPSAFAEPEHPLMGDAEPPAQADAGPFSEPEPPVSAEPEHPLMMDAAPPAPADAGPSPEPEPAASAEPMAVAQAAEEIVLDEPAPVETPFAEPAPDEPAPELPKSEEIPYEEPAAPVFGADAEAEPAPVEGGPIDWPPRPETPESEPPDIVVPERMAASDRLVLDDLLGWRQPAAAAVEPPAAVSEPWREPPPPEEAEPEEAPPAAADEEVPERPVYAVGDASIAPPSAAGKTPFVLGADEPFSLDEAPRITAEASAVVALPHRRRKTDQPFLDAADGSQLQLRLEGAEALAKSGEVRELDIVVPVPGEWVGNRRVTLQLRLTLVPAAEEER
jgi:mutual gliding-motility protein MglA